MELIRRHILQMGPQIGTASGVIATFNAKKRPLKSCEVSFFDSAGLSGLTVTRAGKNLCDPSKMEWGYIQGNGQISGYARNNKSADYIPIEPYDQMSSSISLVVGDGGGVQCAMFSDDASTALTRREYGAGIRTRTETARANEHYVRFYFNPGPYSQIQESTWDSIDIQIERGGAPTAYEPYVGADYTINWASEAGTVYGGTIDLVSGVLVSEYASNGSRLPTPARYQLSPIRIEALSGLNNVWCSAGSTTIKYWAN